MPLRMLVLSLLVCVVIGCSPSSRTGPSVEGVVTLDGKPLPNVTVNLVPAAADAKPAVGTSDKEGVFRPVSAGSGLGVLPGEYKVIVIAPLNPKAPQIPAVYGDPKRTPISVQIPAPGRLEINLQNDAK